MRRLPTTEQRNAASEAPTTELPPAGEAPTRELPAAGNGHDPGAERAGGIGSRTLRGAIWAYSSFVGGRLLVLGSMALLARLLNPRDFGVVGFAMTFLAFIDMLQDLGLTQALVAYRDQDLLERADTVFLASLGIGAGMWLVTFAAAPLAASFFHQSQLVQIMPVLGFNFLARAAGSTHYAIAQQRLDFRSRAGAEMADVVIRGGAGIALAVAGAGVWSLVFGYVVGTVAMTVALWVAVPWRPHLRPKRWHLHGLVRFGGTLAIVDVISALISNVDYLFVGKILGAAALGLYTIGYRLPELLIINLSTVASLAMFPAFAQVERRALRHAYLIAFRYTTMIALPLTAGMLVLAKPLVLTLFGHKWAHAVGPMQVLSLFALAITIDIPAGTVYKAIGKAHILLRLSIPKVLLLIVGLILFTHYGIVPAAACQTVLALSIACVSFGIVWAILGAGPSELWREARASVGSVIVMSFAVLGLDSLIATSWVALVVCVPVGALVYFLGLCVFAPLAIGDAVRKLLPGRFPERAAA